MNTTNSTGAMGVSYSANNVNTVEATLTDGANKVSATFTYARSDGLGEALSFEPSEKLGAGDVVSLPRLTPGVDYKFSAVNANGVAIGETTTVTALATGVDELDSGAPFFTDMSGEPTFDVVVVDYDDGLVGVDKNGYVVFYCEECWEAKSQTAALSIVTLAQNGLQELTVAGETVVTYSGGNNDHFNHECRVDGYDDDLVVVLTADSGGDVGTEKVEAWSRSENKVTSLFSIGDFFDYDDDQGCLSESSDWTHTNCAGTGSDDNYVVGVRHLSAVISVSRNDTSVLEWTLSSEIDSDFAFAGGDEDKFYNAHDVQQLDNGNLLLFDNGDCRDEQWSRAIEYSLDFAEMTATKVWEFKTGEYSQHAGAVTRMANGNTLVAASCDTTALSDCSMLLFEVDADGEEVASMTVPAASDSDVGGPGQGSYRAEAWATLGGEAVVA